MSTLHHTLKALVVGLGALLCTAPVAMGACESAQAPQEQKPSIAILEPTANSAVGQINRMTAYGALQQFIINTKSYKVVDRARTEQILKSQNFDRSSGVVDSSKAKDIGKMLQADMVCATEMRKEDGAFIVICSLIDVESGEMTASGMELIETDTATEVRNAINRAVLTMLGMEAPVAQARTAPSSPKTVPQADVLQDPRQARIAVIIPEVHLTRSIPDPAAETAIIRKLLEAKFTRVVDQNQINKIRESDNVKALLRGDTGAAKSLGTRLGVDYIMVGEAFSESVGTLAGGMFSCRARVEARIIRTDNARIIATSGFHAGGADLTEATSAKVALNNAGEMMGDYMVKQLISAGGSVASGVAITATGALSFNKVSALEKALRGVNGIESVRLNDYSNGVATYDINTNVSVQVLADGIGGIQSPRVEVTEVSGSALKVLVR